MFYDHYDEPALYIPEGINFECTGCGNCCFDWPVPVTDEDALRIASLSAQSPAIDNPALRKLSKSADKLRSFTYSLGKDKDGRCQFIDQNGCRLHREFGCAAKPSMCQLFPYTFTRTPTGVYCGLSFASTGVLLNAGRPLRSQRQTVHSMFELFRSLYPQEPDWRSIQAQDGVSIRWSNYLLVEHDLLELIKPSNRASLRLANLQKCTETVVQLCTLSGDLENEKLVDTNRDAVDFAILDALHTAYFPEDVFANDECSIDAVGLIKSISQPSDAPSFRVGAKTVQYSDLCDTEIGASDEAVDELLTRFLYNRIFSKLYFGPGFASLSLICGLHHLFAMIALVKIRAKIRQLSVPEMDEDGGLNSVMEDVRKLERRLTVASLSAEAHSILEVLLPGPRRIGRILNLAS